MKTKVSSVEGLSPAIQPHPGRYVKDLVLAPRKLTVTAAAKLLDVGRPAFSNFVNENASLTPTMARRLETTFGLVAEELLQMQSTYDAAKSSSDPEPLYATRHVPHFLDIRSTAIEAWADRNTSSRSRLAVLVRTLVNSTANRPAKSVFPGNEDAETPGWDGWTETEDASPWVPLGNTGWELGTNKDPRSKAEGDFDKSVKAMVLDVRQQTTFIFVTPRYWPGKATWVDSKKRLKLWKDVRAYDSSDLEQWMSRSLSGQSWFSSEAHLPNEGVTSLDACWRSWSNGTNPPLHKGFFADSFDAARRTLIPLIKGQTGRPIVVACDSREEGLAFLAEFLDSTEEPAIRNTSDRAIVFKRAGYLPKLASLNGDFVAIISSQEVENELSGLVCPPVTFVLGPRNRPGRNPDFVLETVREEVLRGVLESMGLDRGKSHQLSVESGRSITVLRRQLLRSSGISVPSWSSETGAAKLIPFLFAGTWNSSSAADREVLIELSGSQTYDALERTFQEFLAKDDSPVWSADYVRGIVSRIDMLFAISHLITGTDLERFYSVAQRILQEDNPALDLEDENRWAAAFYGKRRAYSELLRCSIAECVALLSVYGDERFLRLNGFDCTRASDGLVRKLLTPLTARVLQAQDRELPSYAETAPKVFLRLLEQDLQSDSPECLALLKPAMAGPLGHPARTGLLWALELLAWNPKTLFQVASILSRLSRVKIDDNWVNKPMHSLSAIFSSWMPQTAASVVDRHRVLEQLAMNDSDIAWQLCTNEFILGPRTGHYSHKPTWRDDARGFGEPYKTNKERWEFYNLVLPLLLSWPTGHKAAQVARLVEISTQLLPADVDRVWEIVAEWNSRATDDEKAQVQRSIRTSYLSGRANRQNLEKVSWKGLVTKARVAFDMLQPKDTVSRSVWLFLNNWIPDLDEDNFGQDYQKRQEAIDHLREDAIKEIFLAEGISGVLRLVELSSTGLQIGWLLPAVMVENQQVSELILTVLKQQRTAGNENVRQLLRGLLHGLHSAQRLLPCLEALEKSIEPEAFSEILVHAPFRRAIWTIVDRLPPNANETYWSSSDPGGGVPDQDETNEGVLRLLDAKRPRAAFSSVSFRLEILQPDLLYRLMMEIAIGGEETDGSYSLEGYAIDEAFGLLDKTPVLTLEQRAGLELAFLGALSRPWANDGGHGLKNLEEYIALHPELYVQALVWGFKRANGGDDPADWKIPDSQVKNLANKSHQLLEGLVQISTGGAGPEEELQRLRGWVDSVRELARSLDRIDIADIYLGKLLAHLPPGRDGVWPPEAVCKILEGIRSDKLVQGAQNGRYNSRGVFTRGEGGAQERDLANQYRDWAERLQYTYPFVSVELLGNLERTYLEEAERADREALIRRRLR